MKILLIDNYDSFTFNLYHYLSTFSKVDVVRNDKIDSNKILKKNSSNYRSSFWFKNCSSKKINAWKNQ